jgi:hypothetical protein
MSVDTTIFDIDLKCFEIKNKIVVVDSLDTEICSIVQGDIETTNRLSQRNRTAKQRYRRLKRLADD